MLSKTMTRDRLSPLYKLFHNCLTYIMVDNRRATNMRVSKIDDSTVELNITEQPFYTSHDDK